MPSNTTYKPTKVNDFEATKLNFNAQGVSAILPALTTSHLDLLLTDDCLITGVWLVASSVSLGDHVSLQVLDDASGTYTGTPYAVINQFVTNWYLPASANTQFETAYPAKIYAGMTLRVVYTATVILVTPFVAVNYKLHKVLV